MTTSAVHGTVNYNGKQFKVVRSSIVMQGQQEAPLGIVMNTMTFQCPMATLDARGQLLTCNEWIEIVLEFAPSAWFCPACGGMIILDRESQASHHPPSYVAAKVPEGLCVLCYIAESMQQQDISQIMRWLDEEAKDRRFQATRYDPEAQQWFRNKFGRGQMWIEPQFYALDDLGLSLGMTDTTGVRDEPSPPRITCVEQLDQLMGRDDTTIDDSALSAEMSHVLGLFLAAGNAIQAGNIQEAINGYQSILASWPNFVAPRVNLANCLLSVGDLVTALRQLETAHALAPKDPDIHIGAGRIYEAKGDEGKMFQEYLQAVKDDPTSAKAMTNLGIAYRDAGSLGNARQWLEKALVQIEQQERVVGPSDWQLPLKLNTLAAIAKTCEAADRWHQAVQYWEQTVALAPHDDWLANRLQQARMRVWGARSSG